MQGLHIRQVFIAGALLGFLWNEEYEAETNRHIKVLTLCFFIIGIQIEWW